MNTLFEFCEEMSFGELLVFLFFVGLLVLLGLALVLALSPILLGYYVWRRLRRPQLEILGPGSFSD
ncbi:MAG: hypothetical protein KBD16_02550 [Candidatus Pacebacteria bacterium]|nr:hypothetical protein [Candidatus Paceibacterota bacterium]